MAAALRIGWIKNGVPFRRPDVESAFLNPSSSRRSKRVNIGVAVMLTVLVIAICL
jgi:hypothetical protein